MSLLSLVRVSVGEVGIKPGSLKMVSTANLATITTAGYLNGVGQSSSLDIAPSDIIECLYSFNTSTDSGTFVLLAVSITNGVITLSAGAGSEALTSGHIFVGNASNIAADVAMSGDITITNAGVTAIGAGKIVNAQISATAAIAYSKLATLASGNILVGSAGGVATSVVMSGDATIIASGALTIANSAITNAKVAAAAAIDFSKLATLATGHILAGNAGVVTDVTLSGDATIGATGVLTIANNAVSSAKMAINTIQYAAVTVSLAEFTGMYTTPKQLIAAQGANTMIVLDQMVIMQTYGSAALAGGGVVAAQYDSTAHGAGVLASNSEAAADFFQTASTSYQFTGTSGNTVGIMPFATTVNKGLYLSNATGVFTTGTGSSFVAHVWYHVVPTV